MNKYLPIMCLICSFLASAAAAQPQESLIKEAEQEADKVIERLEGKDVPCAWWYYDNGIRRSSAGAEITEAQAQGKEGYYQCQGSCAKGECAAKESATRPGFWVCGCVSR